VDAKGMRMTTEEEEQSPLSHLQNLINYGQGRDFWLQREQQCSKFSSPNVPAKKNVSFYPFETVYTPDSSIQEPNETSQYARKRNESSHKTAFSPFTCYQYPHALKSQHRMLPAPTSQDGNFYQNPESVQFAEPCGPSYNYVPFQYGESDSYRKPFVFSSPAPGMVGNPMPAFQQSDVLLESLQHSNNGSGGRSRRRQLEIHKVHKHVCMRICW
jgi:hypothetical protein